MYAITTKCLSELVSWMTLAFNWLEIRIPGSPAWRRHALVLLQIGINRKTRGTEKYIDHTVEQYAAKGGSKCALSH